jgi:hypothetical protein
MSGFLTSIPETSPPKVFVITEVAGDPSPMSATGPVTKRTAWLRARAQHLPVEVCYLNGECKLLGRVFDPRVYEQAAYLGYVSAGIAMSDGYYAPVKFESWVRDFRRSPSLPEPEQVDLLPALDIYKRALASALGH